jgi:hypothetical protein
MMNGGNSSPGDAQPCFFNSSFIIHHFSHPGGLLARMARFWETFRLVIAPLRRRNFTVR